MVRLMNERACARARSQLTMYGQVTSSRQIFRVFQTKKNQKKQQPNLNVMLIHMEWCKFVYHSFRVGVFFLCSRHVLCASAFPFQFLLVVGGYLYGLFVSNDTVYRIHSIVYHFFVCFTPSFVLQIITTREKKRREHEDQRNRTWWCGLASQWMKQKNK